MSNEIYTIFLIIAGSLIGFFGTYLVVGKIPNRLKETIYNDSRRLIGISFIVIAISIAIFVILNIRALDTSYRAALNISFYFIASKFFAVSYITLLSKKGEYSMVKYKWNYILCYTFPLVVWATVLIPSGLTQKIAQTLCAGFLTFSTITDISFFFKKYRAITNKIDEIHSKDIRPHITWMVKTIRHLIFLGITCSAIAMTTDKTPRLVLVAYLSYFVIVCMIIFFKFINFISVFSDIPQTKDTNSEDPDMKQLTPQIVQHIEKHLEKWVEDKEYCNNSVTIMTASKQMLTNRLYLSTYINARYNYSFKVWLSKLRIAEAKDLMLNKPNMTITAIAEYVGYVSLASFTHAFKNIEGIPPKQWANDNVK